MFNFNLKLMLKVILSVTICIHGTSKCVQCTYNVNHFLKLMVILFSYKVNSTTSKVNTFSNIYIMS